MRVVLMSTNPRLKGGGLLYLTPEACWWKLE